MTTSEPVLSFDAFQKRVALTKNDIFSDFASSRDYTKVSFYKVLDRLTILIQYAVCFVLYKENNSKKTLHHNFLQDPLYSNQMEQEGGVLKIIESSFDEYLFRIFESDYYIAVCKIEKSDNKYQGKRGNIIKPIKCTFNEFKKRPENIESKKDDIEYYYEENGIEDIDDYIRLCCRNIFRVGVDKESTAYDQLIEVSITNIEVEAYDSKEPNIGTSKYISDIRTKFFQSLSGNGVDKDTADVMLIRPPCFDAVYKGLKQRLLLSEKMAEEALGLIHHENVNIYKDSNKIPDKLPNIFFTVRFYEKVKIKRYDSYYNYNIKYILTEEQKKDIKFFLKILRKDTKYKSYLDYCKHDTNDADLLLKIQALDSEFLTLIGTDKGIDEILEILQEPLDLKTRSISDRIFTDGLLAFYIPFDAGGMYRILESSREDKLRTVLFYYLALLSLPNLTENQYIGSIITPIILGDSVWGGCTHFVVRENSKTSFTHKKIWFTNYRYCNSIADRAEHNIAIETRELYLYWIGDIYREIFTDFINKLLSNTNATVIDIRNAIAELEQATNSQFLTLSYFFPYSFIKIKIHFPPPKDHPENIKNPIYIFNKKCMLSFKFIGNNYYPKPKKEFQMYDTTKQSIASIFERRQKRIEDYALSIFNKSITEKEPITGKGG